MTNYYISILRGTGMSGGRYGTFEESFTEEVGKIFVIIDKV